MLTAAGAVPLASLQARAAAEPDAPVRIGYLPITDATPLLVAHNNGLFEAEGIKAERPVLLRSWAQVIEAFISGQVNVIHLLSPMTVWARYGSKVPAKVVAWNHVGGSGLTVAPGITEVKQLGGKTVAIPFWYSIHNVVLQQMLNDNGLVPVSKPASAAGANEVNLLVLPPSDMPPALASKRIAGYIVAEPFNALAENLKVGRVQRFTGDVWRNHACCVVFMHEQDLNNRPSGRRRWSTPSSRPSTGPATTAPRPRAAVQGRRQRYTPHAPAVLTKVLAPAAEDREQYMASGAIQHSSGTKSASTSSRTRSPATPKNWSSA
jgi:NitT/TauT family transport system substrate-binding protein